MARNPKWSTGVEDGDSKPETATKPTPAVNPGGEKNLRNMTHAELDAHAASQDPPVDLSGTSTRDDKIDAIEKAASGS